MPRSLRIEYPGAHYHAMSRGNNGQDIFFDDHGRRLFLSTLAEVCQQTGWVIHAYCLMSNHYHLLLETPEPNLVVGMKWFQGTFTQRVNAMFQRKGHLFQGRYKAIPVQTDPRDGGLQYFRQLSTYIHLNPYRARICGPGLASPLDSYRWSSYPDYCGTRKKALILPFREKVLNSWGIEGSEKKDLKKYKSFVERRMELEESGDPELVRAFERQIKRGWFLGSDLFRERLGCFLGGRSENDNLRGAQRRDHGLQDAERLLQLGLKKLGWTEDALLNAKSVQPEKQAIAWLLKQNTTVTGAWLAERLNMRHRVNVSRAISRFQHAEEQKVSVLKEKMIQCTG